MAAKKAKTKQESPKSEKRTCAGYGWGSSLVSCSKALIKPRAKRCADCKREHRVLEQKASQAKHRELVKAGKAGHRVIFRGTLSKWARASPRAALALLKQMERSLATEAHQAELEKLAKVQKKAA